MWSTCLKRPLVVIHEVFVASVLDICWSSCGLRLCACSKDGTVVFVEFTEKEIGKPLDSNEMVKNHDKIKNFIFILFYFINEWASDSKNTIF